MIDYNTAPDMHGYQYSGALDLGATHIPESWDTGEHGNYYIIKGYIGVM